MLFLSFSSKDSQYSISEVGKFVTLPPIPDHPIFGPSQAIIKKIEADELVPGNILAIQDTSIVTYTPDGCPQYIATSRSDKYYNLAGNIMGRQNTGIHENPHTGSISLENLPNYLPQSLIIQFTLQNTCIILLAGYNMALILFI